MKVPKQTATRWCAAAVLFCVLATGARAEFFDRTRTFTPRVSFAETYAQSLKPIRVPADPDLEIPAYLDYRTVFTYRAAITAVVSLAGFDLATLAEGTPIELTVGEYTFTGELDAASIARRRFTSVFDETDADMGSRSVERATIVWTATTLTASVVRVESGRYSYEEGIRLPDAETSFSSSGPDTTTVSLKIGAVTDQRALLGRMVGRLRTVVRRVPDPIYDGPPVPTEFELFSFAASGATDYTPPRLSFVLPVHRAVSYLPTVAVQVDSDTSVAQVFVRLNGGAWAEATNGTVQFIEGIRIPIPERRRDARGRWYLPWRAALILGDGENVVEAYAVDASGNESRLPERRVTYASVSGPFVATVNSTDTVRGVLRLAITAAGTATGRMDLDTRSFVVRGAVNGDGELELTFTGARAGEVGFASLLFDGDGSSFTTLHGVLALDLELEQFTIDGAQVPFDGRTQRFGSALARGNVSFGPSEFYEPDYAPTGSGFATVSASAAGAVRLVGKFADGAPLSYGGYVDAAGTLAVFLPESRTRGSLVGAIGLGPDEEGRITIGGEFVWGRATNARRTFYPAGFSVRTSVGGGAYTPGTFVLDDLYDPPEWVDQPPTGFTEGSMTLSRGNLAAELTREVTISGRAAVSLQAGPERVVLAINNATGLVTGSFVDRGRRRPIFGIVIPGLGVEGFFIGATEMGELEIYSADAL